MQIEKVFPNQPMMTVNLIDPHTKEIVRTVSAREAAKIIRDKSYW